MSRRMWFNLENTGLRAVNPLFVILVSGMLTLTSSTVLGVEGDKQEATLEKSDHRVRKAPVENEDVPSDGSFVAAGASSGIEFATAVAIGVVGAALISYGKDEVKRNKSLMSQELPDSKLVSTETNVKSTATTTRLFLGVPCTCWRPPCESSADACGWKTSCS